MSPWPEPRVFTVPVRGGELTAMRWGDGPRLVLGIHGITASSISLQPFARRLGPEYSLVAPDLRGRGASAGLPGPFGMRAHADDCAALIEALGGGAVVVVGVSMGAFVGVVLGAVHPHLVERLVLVDGGLPFPMPEGMDVEATAAAILGPALARLRMTFPSVDAYLEYWRVHPAVSETWNDDVEAYLRYDLEGTEPELRSRVSEDAVRADTAGPLDQAGVVVESLLALSRPAHLLRATRNVLNELPPLYPEELVQEWRGRVANLTDEVIDDTNHYSILFGDRGADAVVDRIRERAEVAR